jgi:hypothetical protein
VCRITSDARIADTQKITGVERWKILFPKKLHRRKNSKAGKFSRRPSYSGIWQVVSFTNRLSNKSEFILMKKPHSLTPKSSHLSLDVPSYTPPKSLKKKRSKIVL